MNQPNYWLKCVIKIQHLQLQWWCPIKNEAQASSLQISSFAIFYIATNSNKASYKINQLYSRFQDRYLVKVFRNILTDQIIMRML